MVLIYAESTAGQFKRSAFEAVTYGVKTARLMGVPAVALVMGKAADAGQLGRYGADRVVAVDAPQLASFDAKVFAAGIAEVATQLGAKVVVLAHSYTGKSLLGRLAARLNAGSAPAVNALPTIDGGFRVKKAVFSGKAIVELEIASDIKLLSLMGNALPPEVVGEEKPVETLSVSLPAVQVKVVEVKRVEGIVPLPEAELVVSAGRGMKGPENWGMVEELASVLGATTACSRPVADAHWRPHHEHVGQTGIAIRPNLYIAIGISGAIQHLAGVNSSKTIVVINKDPEAPFFKAADYGVVGDLFEVVPQLTEAFKRYQAR